ncbi:MAG TPA: hypothetical protein VF447_07985, partial [Terriglobales bacterium]
MRVESDSQHQGAGIVPDAAAVTIPQLGRTGCVYEHLWASADIDGASRRLRFSADAVAAPSRKMP